MHVLDALGGVEDDVGERGDELEQTDERDEVHCDLEPAAWVGVCGVGCGVWGRGEDAQRTPGEKATAERI